MGTYTPQKISRAGVQPTENAVAASDTFANDGATWLLVENAGAGSLTVTIVTPKTVDGLAVADRTVTVPAGEKRAIGPFTRDDYNDSDGLVTVQYSATASVTAMCLKF